MMDLKCLHFPVPRMQSPSSASFPHAPDFAKVRMADDLPASYPSIAGVQGETADLICSLDEPLVY